mmetsp:Transcript_48283/g.105089  ORF Transcript_48283/g.105089 Transcript_48283/m.105089 type:complete len:232 (-) Transcript_48283:53-748(-)
MFFPAAQSARTGRTRNPSSDSPSAKTLNCSTRTLPRSGGGRSRSLDWRMASSDTPMSRRRLLRFSSSCCPGKAVTAASPISGASIKEASNCCPGEAATIVSAICGVSRDKASAAWSRSLLFSDPCSFASTAAIRWACAALTSSRHLCLACRLSSSAAMFLSWRCSSSARLFSTSFRISFSRTFTLSFSSSATSHAGFPVEEPRSTVLEATRQRGHGIFLLSISVEQFMQNM